MSIHFYDFRILFKKIKGLEVFSSVIFCLNLKAESSRICDIFVTNLCTVKDPALFPKDAIFLTL